MPRLIVVCKTCGKKFPVYPYRLRVGKGKFCSKHCVDHTKLAKTHGMSKTRLHQIWLCMKSRCKNKSNAGYQYYGGKGIKVCPEWRDSFESFRDWAFANGYQKGLELDRKDHDKDYSPENCRWATRTQQMQNTRKRSDAETSKYKGVSWHAGSRKWRVQIIVNKRNIHVGMFLKEKEAAQAYDAKAIAEFGEFACINFPNRKDGGSR